MGETPPEIVDKLTPQERLSGPLPPIPTQTETPTDTVRRQLSIGLLLTLAGTLAWALLSVTIHAIAVADAKTILDTLIPPLVTLTGTVLGFYFATKSGSDR